MLYMSDQIIRGIAVMVELLESTLSILPHSCSISQYPIIQLNLIKFAKKYPRSDPHKKTKVFVDTHIHQGFDGSMPARKSSKWSCTVLANISTVPRYGSDCTATRI